MPGPPQAGGSFENSRFPGSAGRSPPDGARTCSPPRSTGGESAGLLTGPPRSGGLCGGKALARVAGADCNSALRHLHPPAPLCYCNKLNRRPAAGNGKRAERRPNPSPSASARRSGRRCCALLGAPPSRGPRSPGHRNTLIARIPPVPQHTGGRLSDQGGGGNGGFLVEDFSCQGGLGVGFEFVAEFGDEALGRP